MIEEPMPPAAGPGPLPRFPSISAVQWLPAKDVLGGEASDFTPWLQQPTSMEILGAALKLEELTAVAAEHDVLGKRLDILASALDENGEEVPVCIENQYGISDADHLGRLIAYLAQHERGRAVWVVERAHDAFVAAVRFLNRTSSDDVGYYLVQVRFTHGVGGAYQVHFEVLAAPIAWEKGPRKPRAHGPVNASKKSFLDAVYDKIGDSLLDAGFSSANTHVRGSYLWVRYPLNFWFRPFAKRLDIRVTKNETAVVVYVNGFNTKDANAAAIAALRGHYAGVLQAKLPAGSVLEWELVGSGQRSLVRTTLPTHGYATGDVDQAAEWALATATTWLETLTANPISDLAQVVASQIVGAQLGGDDDSIDDG